MELLILMRFLMRKGVVSACVDMLTVDGASLAIVHAAWHVRFH